MIYFPVFHIREHTVIKEDDGIIYVTDRYGTFILDNRNLHGDTLGERRLRVIRDEKTPLYKLKRGFYDSTELLMHKKPPNIYIDSKGKVFERKKTRTVPLRYYEIQHITILPNGLMCFIEGFFAPVMIPYIPEKIPLVLGVLMIDGEPKFYELADSIKPNTWRKI